MTDMIFECEKCKNKDKSPDLDGCKKCRGTKFKVVYK